MFHKSIKRTVVAAVALTAVLSICTCTEDNSPSGYVATGNEDAVLVTRLDDGVSYVQTVDIGAARDLSDQLSQSNATQVMADWAFIWSYGGHVYVTGYDMTELTRYGIASEGSLTEQGVLPVPANSWLAGMAFVSDTKAYVSLYSTGKVVIFNPSTMKETGSIDLTSYAVSKDTIHYQVNPAAMIIQGERLIVVLHQMNGQYDCDPNAHVVFIDMAEDTVIAHITDSRGCWAACRESVPAMFLDDNDDLYIGCSGLFGMITGMPEGILRIKSGAAEFDPDYFWDISATAVEGEPAAAVGNNAAVYAMDYAGGTRGVGQIINWAYMAAGEDEMTGHYFKPVEFDFIAKTMKVLDIPAGGGYGHGMARYGDKFLFAFEGSDADGVYEYDPPTGETKLLFTTDAPPCYVVGIGN